MDSSIIDKELALSSWYNTMKIKEIEKVHPFSIWHSDEADRWKTHIEVDGKRKLVSKKNKDDLYQFLIEHYKILEASNKYTMATLFPEWMQYKSIHTRSTATMRHYQYDWNKYYDGTDITTVPIPELTRLLLDEWIHSLIKSENLTVKQYANISCIVRQMLDYAVDRGIIPTNPFRAVNVKRRILISPLKKEAETQVYVDDELDRLIEEAENDFQDTRDMSSLAIILCAKTGMRIGECMALKPEDLRNGYLSIQREEVVDTPLLPDGSFGKRDYIVVDHCKTDAGLRKIPVIDYVAETFRKAVEVNSEHCGVSEFLFVKKDGTKMHAKSVDRKIRTLCSRAGISPRSAHKLRKTFISTLIDAGINIDTVRRIAGHKDESVTLSNYCFDRNTPEVIKNQLEKALV